MDSILPCSLSPQKSASIYVMSQSEKMTNIPCLCGGGLAKVHWNGRLQPKHYISCPFPNLDKSSTFGKRHRWTRWSGTSGPDGAIVEFWLLGKPKARHQSSRWCSYHKYVRWTGTQKSRVGWCFHEAKTACQKLNVYATSLSNFIDSVLVTFFRYSQ